MISDRISICYFAGMDWRTAIELCAKAIEDWLSVQLAEDECIDPIRGK